MRKEIKIVFLIVGIVILIFIWYGIGKPLLNDLRKKELSEEEIILLLDSSNIEKYSSPIIYNNKYQYSVKFDLQNHYYENLRVEGIVQFNINGKIENKLFFEYINAESTKEINVYFGSTENAKDFTVDSIKIYKAEYKK